MWQDDFDRLINPYRDVLDDSSVKTLKARVESLLTSLADQMEGAVGENKSVEQLRFYMGEAYNDFSVKVAFKEGFNSAKSEVRESMGRVRKEMGV